MFGNSPNATQPLQTAANPVFTNFVNRRPSTKPSRHRRLQDVPVCKPLIRLCGADLGLPACLRSLDKSRCEPV